MWLLASSSSRSWVGVLVAEGAQGEGTTGTGWWRRMMPEVGTWVSSMLRLASGKRKRTRVVQ